MKTEDKVSIEEEIRELEKIVAALKRKTEILISPRLEDYIILKRDFVRNSSKEKAFMKKYRNILFGLYQNKCPLCDVTSALDLDHWLISKWGGGCFTLLHKNGMKVCNAVPLCEKCNRSKKNRSNFEDFSDERLEYVLSRIMKVSLMLNEEEKLC